MKKMMLLALAALSAALFALPPVASAQEMEVDPGNNAFSGASGGGSFAAAGEPTITWTATAIGGSFASKTTFSLELKFTGAKITVLGFPIACNSAGSPSGTIVTTNVFHAITANNKPAILATPPFPTLTCGSTSLQITGNGVIGTIISPKCNVASTSATVVFNNVGGKQEDMLYTGVNYDLQAATHSSGGADVTAALQTTIVMNSTPAMTMTCQ